MTNFRLFLGDIQEIISYKLSALQGKLNNKRERFLEKYHNISKMILKSPVRIGTFIFTTYTVVVVVVSFFSNIYDKAFLRDFLVNANALILDGPVLGLLILWLNRKSERIYENEAMAEDIHSLRYRCSDYAADKIAINIRRINASDSSMGLDLGLCHLKGAYLEELKLVGSSFSGANLSMAHLSHSDFSKGGFGEANLEKVNANSTVFSGSYMRDSYLKDGDFQHAKLQDVMLGDSVLNQADFSYADLTDAHLVLSSCAGAIFRGANLEYGNLGGCDLENTDFSGANLTNTCFSGAYLAGADFSKTKGLSAQQLIDAQTLYKIKLDSSLLEQIQRIAPELLREPDKSMEKYVAKEMKWLNQDEKMMQTSKTIDRLAVSSI